VNFQVVANVPNEYLNHHVFYDQQTKTHSDSKYGNLGGDPFLAATVVTADTAALFAQTSGKDFNVVSSEMLAAAHQALLDLAATQPY
jgi:hypothetical protein